MQQQKVRSGTRFDICIERTTIEYRKVIVKLLSFTFQGTNVRLIVHGMIRFNHVDQRDGKIILLIMRTNS